jgi:hypothetical protein
MELAGCAPTLLVNCAALFREDTIATVTNASVTNATVTSATNTVYKLHTAHWDWAQKPM